MSYISVGQQSAWAVTHTGRVFMCLGINSKTDSVMSPAWIEIDSLNNQSSSTAANPLVCVLRVENFRGNLNLAISLRTTLLNLGSACL